METLAKHLLMLVTALFVVGCAGVSLNEALEDYSPVLREKINESGSLSVSLARTFEDGEQTQTGILSLAFSGGSMSYSYIHIATINKIWDRQKKNWIEYSATISDEYGKPEVDIALEGFAEYFEDFPVTMKKAGDTIGYWKKAEKDHTLERNPKTGRDVVMWKGDIIGYEGLIVRVRNAKEGKLVKSLWMGTFRRSVVTGIRAFWDGSEVMFLQLIDGEEITAILSNGSKLKDGVLDRTNVVIRREVGRGIPQSETVEGCDEYGNQIDDMSKSYDSFIRVARPERILYDFVKPE